MRLVILVLLTLFLWFLSNLNERLDSRPSPEETPVHDRDSVRPATVRPLT
jgi:hypothetical protein